ncbi:TBC1 domain family member 31 [Diachasmimorpha longicaudata]|uniref:TBC1 domain family member 31 n=1 Tax=Diachasmimorpha longicaudata TaxID=58733 RepID=UPI0030B8FB27
MNLKCASKLQKIGCEKYKLTLKAPPKCLARKNFQHITFNEDEDILIAIDTKGVSYHLQLISGDWWVKKLGLVGQSTFVSFSGIQKNELIIGLTSKDIKILNTYNFSPEKYCLLKAHHLPPGFISFYKSYCLTASRKEAVIWNIKTGKKVHQLRLETKESSIKKALIAPNGVIVILYDSDILQSWQFELFSSENRISTNQYGVRNAKDFIFTDNGRAIIICGANRKLLIYNTKSWNVICKLELPDGTSGVKRVFNFPQIVDYTSKMVAILFEDGCLRFFDLSKKCFVSMPERPLMGVRKAVVSPGGQWLATITFDGSLILSSVDNLLTPSPKPPKTSTSGEIQSHDVHDHLQCVRSDVQMELTLPRLIPILKEFGEYPERHRALIWKTLLRLPDNRLEYLRLSEKILNETDVEMLKKWNLADTNKHMILSVTVERLIQFCPLLGQVSFLPELVFPFVVTFRRDPIAGFETILMILWNFCQKWFEYHPLPPLNVLGIIENILGEVDPQLLEFFYQRGVTSTDYAWPLLKTTFSEVLTGSEWMSLWDHLLTIGRPSMLIFCVVAYNVCNREAIKEILETKNDFPIFIENQGSLSAQKILKMAERLDNEVSEQNHPRVYLRENWKFLPSSGPYPPFPLKEYPNFLIGNLGSAKQMLDMKQDALMMKQERQKMTEILEAKKLKEESENFLRDINQRRTQELEKCFQEQLRVTTMNLTAERAKLATLSNKTRLRRRRNATLKAHGRNSEVVHTAPEGNSNHYEKLMEEVITLYDEINVFLQSLRTSG